MINSKDIFLKICIICTIQNLLFIYNNIINYYKNVLYIILISLICLLIIDFF